MYMYFQKIDVEIRKLVDEAADKAKTDPEIPLEELYNHIVIDPPSDMKVRGCDPTIHVTSKS